MIKTAFCVLLTALAAQITSADEGNLVLYGEEATLVGGSTLAYPFTVKINSSLPEAIALSAWQLRFEIAPSANSTGKVDFDSFSTDPAIFTLYDLFPDPNPPSTPNISCLVTGFASNMDYELIPQDGIALMEIGLTVSADASGVFEIAVIPSSFAEADYWGAEWYSNDANYTRRAFEGMPFDDSIPYGDNSFTIGYVAISPIPEPSAIVLLSIATTLFLFKRFMLRI